MCLVEAGADYGHDPGGRPAKVVELNAALAEKEREGELYVSRVLVRAAGEHARWQNRETERKSGAWSAARNRNAMSSAHLRSIAREERAPVM